MPDTVKNLINKIKSELQPDNGVILELLYKLEAELKKTKLEEIFGVKTQCPHCGETIVVDGSE